MHPLASNKYCKHSESEGHVYQMHIWMSGGRQILNHTQFQTPFLLGMKLGAFKFFLPSRYPYHQRTVSYWTLLGLVFLKLHWKEDLTLNKSEVLVAVFMSLRPKGLPISRKYLCSDFLFYSLTQSRANIYGGKQKCDICSNFKMAIISNTYQSLWVAWRLQIFMVKHWYYSQNKGC